MGRGCEFPRTMLDSQNLYEYYQNELINKRREKGDGGKFQDAT